MACLAVGPVWPLGLFGRWACLAGGPVWLEETGLARGGLDGPRPGWPTTSKTGGLDHEEPEQSKEADKASRGQRPILHLEAGMVTSGWYWGQRRLQGPEARGNTAAKNRYGERGRNWMANVSKTSKKGMSVLWTI